MVVPMGKLAQRRAIIGSSHRRCHCTQDNHVSFPRLFRGSHSGRVSWPLERNGSRQLGYKVNNNVSVEQVSENGKLFGWSVTNTPCKRRLSLDLPNSSEETLTARMDLDSGKDSCYKDGALKLRRRADNKLSVEYYRPDSDQPIYKGTFERN